MREIDRIRAQVKESERLAKRKRSRLSREQGVTDLNKYSPFRDSSKVKNYNRRQLQSYLSELETFRDRRSQFVADKKGRAMRGTFWDQYKSAYRNRKKEVDQWWGAVESEFLPSQSTTVGARVRMTTPDHPHMHNPASNALHNRQMRIPRGFNSEKDLQDYIKQLEQDTDSGTLKSNRKLYMDSIDQMVPYMNASDLKTKLDSLSDLQFFTLTQLGDFMGDVSLWYEVSKALLSGKQSVMRDPDAFVEVQSETINDLIDDITNINQGGTKQRAKTTKGRKRGKGKR